MNRAQRRAREQRRKASLFETEKKRADVAEALIVELREELARSRDVVDRMSVQVRQLFAGQEDARKESARQRASAEQERGRCEGLQQRLDEVQEQRDALLEQLTALRAEDRDGSKLRRRLKECREECGRAHRELRSLRATLRGEEVC